MSCCQQGYGALSSFQSCECWRHMPAALGCSAFSPCFRPLLVSPLFPFALDLCWPYYSVLPCHGFGGRRRCTLPFRRWSFCVHICTRTAVQTSLARHGWKELIHLTPRPKPFGACAVRWMAGWRVCLGFTLPPSNHQAPRTQQPTHDLCMVSYSYAS